MTRLEPWPRNCRSTSGARTGPHRQPGRATRWARRAPAATCARPARSRWPRSARCPRTARRLLRSGRSTRPHASSRCRTAGSPWRCDGWCTHCCCPPSTPPARPKGHAGLASAPRRAGAGLRGAGSCRQRPVDRWTGAGAGCVRRPRLPDSRTGFAPSRPRENCSQTAGTPAGIRAPWPCGSSPP